MSDIDKRDKLSDYPFSYNATKDGKVFISYHGKQVMVLKGNKAASLLSKLENIDDKKEQLILAKITGHFKHGNEKPEKM